MKDSNFDTYKYNLNSSGNKTTFGNGINAQPSTNKDFSYGLKLPKPVA